MCSWTPPPLTSSDYVDGEKNYELKHLSRLMNPAGGNIQWLIWKTINRLRARVAKIRVNMVKWGYQMGKGPDTCECGVSQSDEHLIKCPPAPR